jgi:phage gpG-like protein
MTTGREQVGAAISQMIDRARDSIYREMLGVTTDLAGYIKREKLSGKVLNRISGDLSRSVSPNTVVNGDIILGTVGTNLLYGRVHEYGFSGNVAISAHTRKSKYGMQNVRAHTRSMRFPERSFLRTSLQEQLPDIRQRLANALVRGLNGSA